MSKTKYNVKTVTIKGETHHFVTRGRSKPFSAEEIESFMDVQLEELEPTPAKPKFKIEGHLRRIFAQDLRSGLEFCSQKYGASPDKIYEEAKRLFPQQNLDRIIGA
jgi:hypothetical protein